MLKSLVSLALLASTSGAWAASSPTDFGVRTVGGGVSIEEPAAGPARAVPIGPRVDLSSVARLGAQWGQVTSTYRSRARNRAVGGVRNSYHLSGRAIDIARRRGVSHAQIAAAYRNAGYYLIESLDEGDHSHFAFGSAPRYIAQARPAATAGKAAEQALASPPPTRWRIVTAASAVIK